MKHLLNNLSEQEKNQIREQHTGGMKVNSKKFDKLLNSKVGDVKPLSEQHWLNPMDDASHDILKKQGWSERGRNDDDYGDEGEYYVVFQGEKFYPKDIEYVGYNDLGEIPRVENGKLFLANPMWNQ